MGNERFLSQKLHQHILVILIIVLFAVTKHSDSQGVEWQMDHSVILQWEGKLVIPELSIILSLQISVFWSTKRLKQVSELICLKQD